MIIFAALPVKIVMVFRIITKGNAVFMLIGFVLAYLIVLVLIIRFLRPGYIYMLKWGESKVFWKLSIIPLLFYVYSYLNTGYNFMQTSSMDKFFLQCIPSLIVLLSYILLMDIFKSTNEKQLLKSQQNLVELQLTAATEQIKQLETVERQSAIYRHDLRHHMNYLDVCITENKLMEALGYIAQTCENIDNAHVVQYSQNEPVNLIVSSYVGKAKEKGIKMALDITATDFSRFQIVDLCSLLSNSLENAITACGQMKNVEGRYIKLRMYERSNKLCLDIRNSYAVEPVFEHNIPVSQQEGHGIGVQSILHAVEKYHGVCGFSAKDGVFVFQMSM